MCGTTFDDVITNDLLLFIFLLHKLWNMRGIFLVCKRWNNLLMCNEEHIVARNFALVFPGADVESFFLKYCFLKKCYSFKKLTVPTSVVGSYFTKRRGLKGLLKETRGELVHINRDPHNHCRGFTMHILVERIRAIPLQDILIVTEMGKPEYEHLFHIVYGVDMYEKMIQTPYITILQMLNGTTVSIVEYGALSTLDNNLELVNASNRFNLMIVEFTERFKKEYYDQLAGYVEESAPDLYSSCKWGGGVGHHLGHLYALSYLTGYVKRVHITTYVNIDQLEQLHAIRLVYGKRRLKVTGGKYEEMMVFQYKPEGHIIEDFAKYMGVSIFLVSAFFFSIYRRTIYVQSYYNIMYIENKQKRKYSLYCRAIDVFKW